MRFREGDIVKLSRKYRYGRMYGDHDDKGMIVNTNYSGVSESCNPIHVKWDNSIGADLFNEEDLSLYRRN